MTLIDTLASLPLTRAIGWTVVHFFWQGTLIAAAAGVALALLRGKNARARYAVCCAGMALMLLAPLVTLAALSSAGVTPQVLELSAAFTESAALAGGQRLSPLLPWITLVWLVGFSLLQCRTFVFWARAQRMKRRSTRPLSPDWQRTVSHLCDRIGVRRAVRVVESTLAEVPMLIGWLVPVILVPTGALCGLTPRQLRAVLAHELAHVRRHDALVNLVQAALESLLFFHPAVWWISDRMRAEREYCCDDVAVEVCGDTLCYARALSTLENMRGVPHPAVAANGGSLMNRIFRLVRTHPDALRPPRGNGLTPLLLATSLVVLFAAAGLAVASGSSTSDAIEPAAEPSAETPETRAHEPAGASEDEPTDEAQLRREIERRKAVLERLQRELEHRRAASGALESSEQQRERLVYEEQLAGAKDAAQARRELERQLDGQQSEAAEFAAQLELERALEVQSQVDRQHAEVAELAAQLELERAQSQQSNAQREHALQELERALKSQEGDRQQERDALLELERALQLQIEQSHVEADVAHEELDRMLAAEEREVREHARGQQRDDRTSESEEDLKRRLAERDKVIADLNLQLAELQKLTLLRKLRRLEPGEQVLGSKKLEKLERKRLKQEAAEEKARIKELKEEAKRNKKRAPAQ